MSSIDTLYVVRADMNDGSVKTFGTFTELEAYQFADSLDDLGLPALAVPLTHVPKWWKYVE